MLIVAAKSFSAALTWACRNCSNHFLPLFFHAQYWDPEKQERENSYIFLSCPPPVYESVQQATKAPPPPQTFRPCDKLVDPCCLSNKAEVGVSQSLSCVAPVSTCNSQAVPPLELFKELLCPFLSPSEKRGIVASSLVTLEPAQVQSFQLEADGSIPKMSDFLKAYLHYGRSVLISLFLENSPKLSSMKQARELYQRMQCISHLYKIFWDETMTVILLYVFVG